MIHFSKYQQSAFVKKRRYCNKIVINAKQIIVRKEETAEAYVIKNDINKIFIMFQIHPVSGDTYMNYC